MIQKLIAGVAAVFLLTSCGLAPAQSAEQPTPIPTFPPAASAVQAAAADQPPALGGKQSGDLLVWLFSNPIQPVRGNNTFEVLIVNADGQPVSDAEVFFDIDMTNMSHGKNVTAAEALGDGRYSGDVFFLMPGPWRVIVGIERPGETTTVRFDFIVNW